MERRMGEKDHNVERVNGKAPEAWRQVDGRMHKLSGHGEREGELWITGDCSDGGSISCVP